MQPAAGQANKWTTRAVPRAWFLAAAVVSTAGSAASAMMPEHIIGAVAEERLPDGRLVDWCLTESLHGGNTAGTPCPIQGTCDIPSIRDLYIPGAADEFITIRLKFNVFAFDNGTGATATQEGVNAQLVELNANYAPLRIQFIAATQFINSTQFRNYDISEDFAMKSQFADNPMRQCNIYVVNNNGFAFGTFPWNPVALMAQGGIVIDQSMFGPGQRILAHEVGHCLGLWHTHHGVSEVGNCTPCYELANGSNGNTAGDYCRDTPPTPVNFQCAPPGGADCLGTPWGPTSPQNYMGYAPNFCLNQFTPQQAGRVHCWTRNFVYGWITDCNHNGFDDIDDVLTGGSADCNFNLNPDECELDCNANGIPDVCEFSMGVEDCDGNGNVDDCDPDFDGDGSIDACDDDIDNDGVPNGIDVCDFTVPGAPVRSNGAPINDTDGDCDVDLTDYRRFRLQCFSIGGPGTDASQACQSLYDGDGNGTIDLIDFSFLQNGFTGDN